MKKGTGIILASIAAAAVMLGGCSFGPKPEEKVALFLDAMQEFDMKTMSSCVKDSDWEGDEKDMLEEKELNGFFENTLSKMTYTLEEAKIDGDAAVVPAKIKYFDATDLIGDTISEYMEKVVESAFSGKELTEEEYSSMLGNLLTEKSKDAKDKFSEAAVKFKCVKKDGDWLITDLDDSVLNVMSSNFYEIGKELDEEIDSLADSMEGDQGGAEEGAGAGEEPEDTSDEGADIGASESSEEE